MPSISVLLWSLRMMPKFPCPYSCLSLVRTVWSLRYFVKVLVKFHILLICLSSNFEFSARARSIEELIMFRICLPLNCRSSYSVLSHFSIGPEILSFSLIWSKNSLKILFCSCAAISANRRPRWTRDCTAMSKDLIPINDNIS
jgi:hypothetical protein